MGIRKLWSDMFGAKPAEQKSAPVNRLVQRIYLFVSSTFNDMHAERDYLVKYVFPELKDWCFTQGLELVDIDLRWGITDQEAAMNQTVDTCLNIIRMNAPMLLLNLTGERTGWVPETEQVSASFREAYPAMRSHYGSKSITELEVLFYELITILDGALFLIRQPEGPCDWNEDQKKCYTNYGEKNQNALDRKLSVFKKKTLRGKQACTYRCRWDPERLSPELIDAEAGGEKLSQAAYGRFKDFSTADGQPLKDFILAYFKRIISAQIQPDIKNNVYSGHDEAHIQHRFLIQQGMSYLPAPDSFEELERAIEASDKKRFLLISGEAGTGKSSYLANFILTHQNQYNIHYRFLGISSETKDEISVLNSLVRELADLIFTQTRKLSNEEIRALAFPDTLPYLFEKELISRYDIAEGFPCLMNQMEASLSEPVFLVLDGLDQLDYASMSWSWINSLLYFVNSCRVRFIISCKSGTPHEKMLRRLAPPSRAMWMDAWVPKEKAYWRNFIHEMTSRHMKHLTEEQEERLLCAPQSSNFLFLKSAIEEICTWGIRTRLDSYLDNLAGQDLQGTFQTILSRAEQDPPYCRIPPETAIPTVLGLLAYSRYGLSFSCMHRAARSFLLQTMNYTAHSDGARVTDADITEAIHYYTYQLKHFLIFSHGRVDILYDSFRQACQDRFSRCRLGYHTALGQAYCADMKPEHLCDFDTREAYLEFPYHIIAAEDYHRMAVYLSDLAWLSQKAQLGQIYQIPELYRCLPQELQEPSVMSWFQDYESTLTREPLALPSLCVNFFPEKEWVTENTDQPWLKYVQTMPEFQLERESVRKILQYNEEIEFPETRVHNNNVYLSHGGMAGGMAAFDAATLQPRFLFANGINEWLHKLLPDEDVMIQGKGSEVCLYRLLPDGGGAVLVRIKGIPKSLKMVDMWYERGSLYVWTTRNKADICLFRTELDLSTDGVMEFETLSWKKLYDRSFQESYHDITASSAKGIGVITMQEKNESGWSILYTNSPFKVLSERPYPVTHWQERAPGLLLLHKYTGGSHYYTELMTRDGKLLLEANAYLDVTPMEQDGAIFFHVNGLSSPDLAERSGNGPLVRAGTEDRFPIPPAGDILFTAHSGEETYKYAVDARYFYRFQLKNPQNPPEALVFYPGSTMFLEKYEDCLLTQELTCLHMIPLSGKKRPFQIKVPQNFLGSGFGSVPGTAGNTWQIDHGRVLFFAGEDDLGFSRTKRLTFSSIDLKSVTEEERRTSKKYKWQCEGSGWSCRLDENGGLTLFHGGIVEHVDTGLTAPQTQLYNCGILCFWQNKTVVIVNPARKPGETIAVYEFSDDIMEIAADQQRIWFVAAPVDADNYKSCRIFCLLNGTFSNVSISLPRNSSIVQVSCEKEYCILVYGEEVPNNVYSLSDIRVGAVLGPTRTVRKMLITNGQDVVFDPTDWGFRKNKEFDCPDIPGYNTIIGQWDEYAIIKSDSRSLACLYNYKRNEIVCSFPLPGDISHAERLGQAIYFTRADKSGIVAAELHKFHTTSPSDS